MAIPTHASENQLALMLQTTKRQSVFFARGCGDRPERGNDRCASTTADHRQVRVTPLRSLASMLRTLLGQPTGHYFANPL
jgi:hypothetical protein